MSSLTQIIYDLSVSRLRRRVLKTIQAYNPITKYTEKTFEQQDIEGTYKPPVNPVDGSVIQNLDEWKNIDKDNSKFMLDSSTRMKYFAMCLLISAVCFLSALFYLPILLLAPDKFASLISIANICAHFAISFTYPNPFDYVRELSSKKETLGFAALYILALFGTLYASLYTGGYVLVLVFSCLQFSCVMWLLASYVPGGTFGLQKVIVWLMNYLKPKFIKTQG